MRERRTLLLSIRPRFAELILSGSKSVELRRVPPKVAEGDLILLYASSPVRELVGVCAVARVDVASRSELWKRHGRDSGLQKSEFGSYLNGAARPGAISLLNPRRVVEPRTLDELRELLPGFSPPQSFCYVSWDTVRKLELFIEGGALLGADEDPANRLQPHD